MSHVCLIKSNLEPFSSLYRLAYDAGGRKVHISQSALAQSKSFFVFSSLFTEVTLLVVGTCFPDQL